MGGETKIVIDTELNRATKLDFRFLVKIFERLQSNETLKRRTKYYPNTTLYELDGTLRYIELNNDAVYEISSIEANEYIFKVLEFLNNGSTKDEVISKLVSNEISLNEAEDFFDDLVECQLIVSELNPNLTGKENLERCIQILEENTDLKEFNNLLNQLKETNLELRRID